MWQQTGHRLDPFHLFLSIYLPFEFMYVHFEIEAFSMCLKGWELDLTNHIIYIHWTWVYSGQHVLWHKLLRIPDTYEAKIAKIGNFWTFWPVIQLIKDGLLAELQTKTSRRCIFSLFLAQKYQVSLQTKDLPKSFKLRIQMGTLREKGELERYPWGTVSKLVHTEHEKSHFGSLKFWMSEAWNVPICFWCVSYISHFTV